MINIEEQKSLFARIGKILPKRIEVYVIGGTAMMFLGLKENTLDVDIVFSNPEDRRVFYESTKSVGFRDSSAEIVYGKKENTPEMVTLDDVRFDLFLFKIITSTFSNGMKERAIEIHEFGNFVIRVADPSDVIIMKSATSREKDLEDIISIARRVKIDWNIIIEEAKEQIKLGNEGAILELGEKLEKLSSRKALDVPKEILDKLWDLLVKQVREKARK